jgi:hypothetical protein
VSATDNIISRLNRTTTARDMYDLAWVAQHQRKLGGLDTDLIRRLAVLKIWVDARGLGGTNAAWKPGHEPRDFDPGAWLRVRSAREFDLDDIGALAVPVPTWPRICREQPETADNSRTRLDRRVRPLTVLRLVSGLKVLLSLGAPGRIRTCAFASGGRRSIP